MDGRNSGKGNGKVIADYKANATSCMSAMDAAGNTAEKMFKKNHIWVLLTHNLLIMKRCSPRSACLSREGCFLRTAPDASNAKAHSGTEDKTF